ncbi:MAG: PilZ domain-containing protein [Acidobacteriia bacterium]|nr:PilZ domain-containing protein [Terriglobia bacterium]
MGGEADKKILLLDGDDLGLDFEKTFLERPEIRFVEAPRGEELLAALRRERPDLLVVGIHASNPESLRICREVKSDRALDGIPVLLLSTPTLRREAESSGADALVFKPLVQREFLEVVRGLLAVRERRSARYPVRVRIAFVHEREEIETFSQDLSETGAFLRSTRLPPPGARIPLRLRLPGDENEIACDGVVRGPRGPGRGAGGSVGFGVEFDHMIPSDRFRLSRFVRDRLSRPVELP